jgi:hypothetical protein
VFAGGVGDADERHACPGGEVLYVGELQAPVVAFDPYVEFAGEVGVGAKLFRGLHLVDVVADAAHDREAGDVVAGRALDLDRRDCEQVS